MSKSVDETVFDFFSVLLQEAPEEPAGVADSETPLSNSTTAKTDNATNSIAATKKTIDTHEALINEKTAANPRDINSVDFKKKHSKVVHKPVAPTDDVPQLNEARVAGTSQQSKAFAEPPVDKAALSKLLSVVSKHAEPAASATIKKQGVVEPTLEKTQENLAADIKQPSSSKVQDDIKLKAQLLREKLSQASPETQPNSLDKKIDTSGASVSKVSEKTADISLEKNHSREDTLDSKRESSPALQTGATPPSVTQNLQEVLDNEFQVLFFNVAGLTLAVPLVSLGGIVKIEHISHLIGRPDWFLGVQTRREQKVNVVDSCRWVMPEKYTKELAESVDYQYLVMLEDSDWGLACESLVNAVKIDKSQVNWREKPGKRPWLAGVVKEQMCGILNVQALIEMLDAGLGCQDSID
ncbi:chemotaxis protein CheW [Shewanella sp. MMG014]|uniref:chemotaxis protein CheW n=1 Tax=Shewanella sp. MMG014 TaxID=2822691 RepID=UPI001FFC8299|nr:chemotaxis protein CheW [Shewanella sp. MMG014]